MNMQQELEVAEMEHARPLAAGVGRILREAREAQGMSVNDVANRIKFAPKQIEWLEEDDYLRLPEAAFVRGFVRSYGRMLGLDVAELLALLPTTHAQPVKSQEVRPKTVDIPLPTELSTRRYNIILLVAALVIAISLALFQRTHNRTPDTAATSTAGTSMPSDQVVVQPLELPSGKAGEAGTAAGSAEANAALSAQPEQAAAPAPAPVTPVVAATTPVAPVITTMPIAAPAPAPAPLPAAVPAQAPVVKAPPVEVRPPSVMITPSPVIMPAAPAPAKAEAPAPAKAATAQPSVKKQAAPKNEAELRQLAQEQAAQLPSLQPLLMYQSGKPALADSPQHVHQQTLKRSKPLAAEKTGATAAANAAGLAAGDHALRLEFDADSWTEIKDGEGKIITSRMHPAGSLVRIGARGELDVVIGNAKAVRLFDNGKQIDLLRYISGEVAHIKLK